MGLPYNNMCSQRTTNNLFTYNNDEINIIIYYIYLIDNSKHHWQQLKIYFLTDIVIQKLLGFLSQTYNKNIRQWIQWPWWCYIWFLQSVNDYTQMTLNKVRQLSPNWSLGGLFNNIVHGQALTCTDIIIM